MRKRKHKKLAPVGQCIFLLIIGLILGTVFTFGEQYWSAEVPREACPLVETQFLSYKKFHTRNHRPSDLIVDCANGERYSIDHVSVNDELKSALSALSVQEEISLLIHPNSSTILEFSCEHGDLLTFEDTLGKLRKDAQGFFYMGLFMYFSALLGLYHLILRFVRRHRGKKK